MYDFNVFLAVLVIIALVGGACNAESVTPVEQPDHTVATGEVDVVLDRVDSEEATFRLVRVAGGLQNPWGMAFLPDGSLLVNERAGRMNIVRDGEATPVSGLPPVHAERQGGLLDVVPHPDYGANGWIYFTFSHPGEGGAGTALARGTLDGAHLENVEIIYSMEPRTPAGQHFGSRIAFLDDGTLLFTIGDRGEMRRAQDPMDPAGSTIRLNDDGSIPDDNPFVGRDGHLPELYTIGNRNSQGMAVHPETGEVWQTEHGPRGGDELNLIRAGENYGWPEATWGADYRTRMQIGVRHDRAPQYAAPVEYWTPAIAPSGLTFYTGDAFPGWSGHLFAGSLVQQKLIRIVLDGDQVTHQEDLLQDEIGRIRDVHTGPDGYIYLLNDQADGGVYRLEPVEE